MASCVSSFGSPKKRYKTEYLASEESNRLKAERPEEYYSTYFCYVCYHYHVGRRKISQLYDEVLVGKLIGALKTAINKGT